MMYKAEYIEIEVPDYNGPLQTRGDGGYTTAPGIKTRVKFSSLVPRSELVCPAGDDKWFIETQLGRVGPFDSRMGAEYFLDDNFPIATVA